MKIPTINIRWLVFFLPQNHNKIREYYKKNRDEIIKKTVERKRLYRANNRDEYNQKSREYRAKKKMEQNKGEA